MKKFWGKLEELLEKNQNSFKKNELNNIRGEIFRQCALCSQNDKGFFELCVPTGGGKTLSSLRFAVGHAKKHNLDRIIFIIPFLNILEQNAKVVKELLDKNGLNSKSYVLESHSNVINEDYQKNNQAETDYKVSEFYNNWDEPIVFTTMVQFLENVYAGGTNAVRRFHNMANAVLIFDEIQALPIKCIYMFNLLVKFLVYFANSTVLLCSATQPPLSQLESEMSLPVATKIVAKNYPILKRTRIINKVDVCNGSSYDEIADFALQCAKDKGSCLVVVNTKSSVTKIFQLLKESTILVYCLTTNLCAEHRSEIIDEIKAKLKNKEQIICVSTSLIEAGVDIDFASVIRFIAGIDNIIQSAGRCNREGKLADSQGNKILGDVYLFYNKNESIGKLEEIKQAQDFIIETLHYGEVDFFSEKIIEKYYKNKFKNNKQKFDYPIKDFNGTSQIELLSTNDKLCSNAINRTEIGPIFASFKTAGQNFKVIDNDQISVIVPYRTGKEIIEAIRNNQFDVLKKAQRYTVNIYTNNLSRMNEAVEDLGHGIFALKSGFYHDDLGVQAEFVNQNQIY
ncbi:MAG: CRISPR-associated helicase Cas3' [Clostridia bacterium]|nr:CRISPR-associated helicase Cas3' [Clostridia bacterium]